MSDVRDRGHRIRFGLVTPQMWRSFNELCDLWSRAERAGWEAAFLVDHFLSDWDGEGGDNLEAFTTLAGLAREVPRIEIGSYVASVTHRPPAVLAKTAVTVDHISGGRLIFGIGAGWNEREHQAYGIDFPSPAERVDQVAETLEALRLLETQDETTFAGRYLALDRAPFHPKPVRGRLPVLVGSRRPRMLDNLARFGDLWDAAGGRDDVERIGEILDDRCRAHKRDPDQIAWMHEEIGRDEHATPDGLEARVAELAPVGVSWFLVNAWPKRDSSFIERLAPSFDRLRKAWSRA